jgi:hypothetical protein
MFERGLGRDEVIAVIEGGETITDYPEDRPYPSVLMLGFASGRPIHVVVARDVETGVCIVVTAYEPPPEHWEPGFKKRRTP